MLPSNKAIIGLGIAGGLMGAYSALGYMAGGPQHRIRGTVMGGLFGPLGTAGEAVYNKGNRLKAIGATVAGVGAGIGAQLGYRALMR